MSLTHATATRNAFAQKLNDLLTSGCKLRFRDGTTTIVDIPLDFPAFGAPSIGVITLEGVPLDADAVATGDIDNVQLLNGSAAIVVSGTVTVTGGGGDLEINNITVNSGQNVAIQSLTYAAPV